MIYLYLSNNNCMIYTNELNNDSCFIGYLHQPLDSAFIEQCYQYCTSLHDYVGGESGWGKEIPRLQKWYQEDNIDFSHKWKSTFKRWKANKYNPSLTYIQTHIQSRLIELGFTQKNKFNSCLINMYRDENDSIKPHFDSMEIFGSRPFICILSLGDERDILFKRKIYDKQNEKSLKIDKNSKLLDHQFTLTHGSILIMGEDTQKYYMHSIPKCSERKKTRYSMTFRYFPT